MVNLVVTWCCFLFVLFHSSHADRNITCPERCVCREVPITTPSGTHDLVWAHCRQDKFTSIPPAATLPEDIYGLDMGFNQIKSLAAVDTMETLQMLDLEANGLTNIEPNAFNAITKLSSLDLGFNNISELFAELFAGLSSLRVLKLSTNNIEHLSEEIFDGNAQLEELHLNTNPLRMIYAKWFRNTPSLKKLVLSKTQLFTLSPEVFHYTHSLEHLDLSENLFQTVPTEALRGAKGLKTLILDRNPINRLDEDSFSNLSELRELQLCQMDHLIEILQKTFAHQYNLEKLVIADNPELVYMDRLAFFGSYNSTWLTLKEVSLKGNRLSTLNENSLDWNKLKRLELSQNPWKCDCKLAWLTTCDSVIRGPRCAEPFKYKGLEVHAVDTEDYRCKTGYQGDTMRVFRILVILLGGIILFFLGLGLVLVIKRHQLVRWWSEKKRGTGSIYYVKANSIPGDSQIDFS